MAKIDSFPSRSSATSPQRNNLQEDASSTRRGPSSVLVEDDLLDPFYRPAAPAKPRAGRASAKISEDPVSARANAEDDDEPFLRARRRVPVRKGLLPRNRVARVGVALGAVLAIAVLIVVGLAVRSYFEHDPRFRIARSSSIQILGNSELTRPQLLSVFGSDIGGNIFVVPLAQRRQELESLPWVEHATVMRLLPNQLRVAVKERTPVAFVRAGNEIALVDANGVILEMSAAALAAHHYSFPVLDGIHNGDPLSTRAARMRLYRRFLDDIDSGGEKLSGQLSEVDLSDPEDVQVVVPAEGSDILLHLGDQEFLARFHSYQAHLAEWRRQYPKLASVDLRYEKQVVLEMQKGAELPPPSVPHPAEKAISAAHAARPVAAKAHGGKPVKPAATKKLKTTKAMGKAKR